MKVNVKKITGAWDLGFSLDKHTISSEYLGDNEYGRSIFNTIRTDIGEAIYQLKYKSDFNQVNSIATELNKNIVSKLPEISFIMAMPPSKERKLQPVIEIADKLGEHINKPCIHNLLFKSQNTPQMKDIDDRDKRVQLLSESFQVDQAIMNQRLPKTGYNVLIIDDLFDSGTSLEVASQKLRECGKIDKILVATATRTDE